MYISGERAYDLMNRMSFIRLMGTDGEKRGARVLFEEIESMGLKPVIEEFKLDSATLECNSFSMVTPREVKCCAYANMLCKDTPEGGETVPFAYTDVLTPNNVKQFAGKAVLVNQMSMGYEQMANAGIKCFLYPLGRANASLEPLGDVIRMKSERNKLTSFFISTGDAVMLIKEKADTVHYEAKSVPCEITSQNVIVELPGTERPNDVIVLGGHYDSVSAGVGASDNAGGCVLLMELLRYFKDHPAKQTLRFMWFGGEEDGLNGSRQYVKRHKDELETIKLMINLDVAGSITGEEFVEVSAEESVVSVIRFIADELGWKTNLKHSCMSSDSTTFNYHGIPAISFGKNPSRGLRFIHSRDDLPEYCSAASLEATGNFIVACLRRILDAKTFPIPRSLPEKIATEAKSMIGGYEQMEEQNKQNEEESKQESTPAEGAKE